MFLEGTVEIGEIVEAAGIADFGDGSGGVHQHPRRLSKADVTFENGKYYTRTVRLGKQPVSSITMDGGAVKFLYGGTPASEAL